MRALKWLLCFSLIIMTCLPALGSEYENQYGIELRGGRNMYLNMSDPNDYVKTFPWTGGYGSNKYDKSVGSFGGGISVLYKSKPYFAWHVGLNVLGTDSASAIAYQPPPSTQSQRVRVLTRAVELFFTANYYLNLSPRFNLEFGAGPAFYLASMDRERPDQYDEYSSFYGAHGRAFGFVGTVGAELFLTHGLSIMAGGGFRLAHIGRFKYIEETSGVSGQQVGKIAYWRADNFNTFEADFTGAFAHAGLRIYFEPKGEWGHGELGSE
jgi:hypothetical protein